MDYCVIFHWYASGAGERTVGRTVTWLPKFLGWMDYQIFLGMGLRSPAKNVYACSGKNDTWSISGNDIGSETKMPAKCCSDERSDGSFFLAVTALQFLATVRDQNLLGQRFDVSVFSRECSVLKLAKNRIGMVWFSVIDVEIAGLHVEDMPKRWVIFALFVYCMFRATRYKKKL